MGDQHVVEAGARLARWRGGVPFGAGSPDGTPIPGATLTGRQLWRLRLAASGWSEDDLLAQLAAPTTGSGPAAGSPLLGPAGDPAELPPLLAAAGGLIEHGRRSLGAVLRRLVGDAAEWFPDPDGLVGQMVAEGLHPLLGRLLHRTLLAELGADRVAGRLTGDTGEERFTAFALGFADPERRCAFFRAHPLLAAQLELATRQWLDAARELLERLVADRPALVGRLVPDGAGAVVSVRSAGDTHRSGRAVALVGFASGSTVVYKPRPMSVDRHFQDLVAWVNARVPGLGLRTVDCVDRGGYGWAEFVRARPCSSLRTFYHRQGALLALLYLLGGTDAHAENLVAEGDQPVLVDLETLCQPRCDALLPVGESPAEAAAAALVSGSVLYAGLLPAGGAGWAGQRTGLGGQDGSARAPVRLPAVVDGGTDRMRLELRHPTLPTAANQPAADVRLADYADVVVDGFTSVYRVLEEHRAELAAPSGPLGAFASDSVRVLVRDTSTYGMLLGMATHPRVLRDRWGREQLFDLLWREVARRPGLAAVVEAERRALLRGDVPVFTARVDGGLLRADDGSVVLSDGVTPGSVVMSTVLARLGPADLARQVWLIRACLLTNGVRWDEPVVLVRSPVGPVPAAAGEPDPDEALLGLADRVAGRLGELAVEDSSGTAWLGVDAGSGRNWRVGVLGPDRYAGGLGIALFLAHHGALTGSAEHLDRARRAVRVAVEQVSRGYLDQRAGGPGLLGFGGVVQTLAELSRFWPELADTAVALLPSLDALVAADEQFAVMDGAAGALLGLTALHRCRPTGPVRDAVAAAAHRLLDGQDAATGGWLPRHLVRLGVSSRPLAGYAHGASGVAAALVAAAEVLPDERVVAAAVRGVEYERSLFDPALGNWRDIRDPTPPDGLRVHREGDWTGVDGNSVAWCHGAPGIGLARLRLLRVVPDAVGVRHDLDAAVAATLRGGFGNGHSLCHGDFGSLELPVAARDGGAAALGRQVRRRAAAVVEDIARGGWRCGLQRGLETPGLFTGLAGIGYGALRALGEPSPVPSALA